MGSRLRAWANRFLWSRQLRPVEGVVAGAVASIPVQLVYAAITYWMGTHPEATPFLEPAAMVALFALQTAVVLPFTIGVLLAALVALRRWPRDRLLAHVAISSAMAMLAFGSYVFGHSTDLFGAMAMFAGATVGILLFDARIVRTGLLSFVAVVLATTLAERMGELPYAPAYASAPFAGGRIEPTVLIPHGFAFALLVGVAFLFVSVTERLRRATAVIRRYVPAQLAEKILTGKHSGASAPERRRVTLFFSDVVGFTRAADRMEGEALAAMLNEYLGEMADIADSFGATVGQFVGDGIMIFFGAPEATNDRDHALRAVRMAEAMQRRMEELRAAWAARGIPDPFRIRIGIHSGIASVGDFGSEGRTTYSAIGSQTNLTARIQDHCEPDRILISDATWALIRDEIACSDRGEIRVKGLDEPVHVYEVE